jgi:hypothetical protein
MDAELTSLLPLVLAKLTESMAGEAGRKVWESLVTTVRRLARRDEARHSLEAVEASRGSAKEAQRAADLLSQEAAANPDFEAALVAWLSVAAKAVNVDSSVTNIVASGAQIRGPVIQTNSIAGGLTLDVNYSEREGS